MRVAHVHRISGVGGSERHLLALLPGLAAVGVDPVFVGLDDPAGAAGAFYERLAAAGIPTVRLPCPRDLDPGLLPRLVRALRDLEPHLVHTHLVHADVYGLLAAARLGLPVVSTKHNDDRFRTGWFRFVERALTRRARATIAISEALARFCVERVGLPSEKVTVVPYGLDGPPEPWGPNPDVELPQAARILLAVARLVEQKGLDTAVAALPAIRSAHPEAILVVLGEGPLRERLEAEADALGVREALRLPGRAGDVAAWLRRTELLVHPARWEGFGLVVLEAMLAGLPVVASRVGAIPEIALDGETGLLVPPDEPAALAAAVAALLGDGDLARSLGAAGLARARAEFSVDAMARRTLAVYEASAP
jgi:glycosyltransferase involved in cell wall biosynthesis